ncbi:MAG: thioredoxin domain-containing protein [Candidatus Omnitrophota bacterium]|nr:thioredoxin domain-containing protein [Candidatus Omnitrophota bacterium]
MSVTKTPSHKPNRLIHEKSPYLLQHAYNPVDWYPWGEEAFAKARQEQKPIFLSIGYSTCHWCHVMEHESFENPDIAAAMNRWFVSIKVDREEHPDLDQVYMTAVQSLTGHGGWPLSVFLTPELKPFYGGTYFPPERRFNMPGMNDMLPAVAGAWQQKREEIMTSADELTASLQAHLAPPSGRETIAIETLHAAFNQAVGAFDAAHGGFGDAPKFPRSPELSFLLAYWARTGTGQALEMVTTTLDHMSRGGIHDHLGGGFHRYATDAQWLVPHFEKMLYDQALLARTYLEAYRATKRPEYAKTARGIFAYVLRDLTDPGGGFYSAEDADSEGAEGKCYVWTPQEITQVLGSDAGELFNRFYGVTPDGNFEHGASILNVEQPLEIFATLKGVEPGALAQQLASSRERLLAVRASRVRPHRDDKILTSWNGLMIASLAYGAATLDDPRYLEAARRAADFVLTSLRRDGVLLRRYREGDARYPGTLEDYAFFSYGLLELYEASFDPRYLAEAKALATQMLTRFWDDAQGGFFLRSREESALIVRAKDAHDGATPSGNSMALHVLLRLGRLTGDDRLETAGRRALETFAATVARVPFGFPQLLMAWDFALGPTKEIVIAADSSVPEAAALVRTVRERFLPRAVTLLHPPGNAGAAIEALVPYVKPQGLIGGKPAVYVCEQFVCRLPATTVAEVQDRLLEESR